MRSLRVRELGYNNSPKAVVLNHAIALPNTYVKKFCIESLTGADPKTLSTQSLVYTRLFHRDTFAVLFFSVFIISYVLDPLVELLADTKAGLSEFLATIAKHYGCC